MAQIEKLIAKMRNNPRDWKIEDIKAVADRFNIEYRQPGTSHVTFRTSSGEKLTIPARKPIKPVYIKQFIALLDGSGGESE